MSIGLVLVLAAGLAASDAPAAGQGPAPATPPAAAAPPKQNKEDRVICRTIVPSGSRLGGTRVCRTQAEWNSISRDASDAVSHAQMNGATGTLPGH